MLPHNHPQNGRITRNSRACLSCRTRKVRCDSLQTGFPCTRCRVDGFSCEAQQAKKRRKKTSSTTHEPGSCEMQLHSLALPPTKHVMHHQIPYSPFLLDFSGVHLEDDDGRAHSLQGKNGSDAHPRRRWQDPDISQFLKKKGVFDLPPVKTIDNCVSSYFHIFHPFFPVIDKTSFLEDYNKWRDFTDDKTEPVPSLLLLQSVLFIASSFVSVDCLRELGFSSRKDARKVFHMRARYLYDFDYESNDIISIQALLLMSHYYPSMVDQKHTWHWVYQAISLAQGIGLHQDPGDVPQRKLWARIWWTCLVRDRLVSLGTGRPMHINSLDCTVAMLSPEDLVELDDGEEESTTKSIFLDFVKLCQYMEGILSLQHISLLEDMFTDQVGVCENTLQLWLDNISSASRSRDECSEHKDGSVSISTLYRAVLHLIYQTVIIALYQPFHLRESSSAMQQLPRQVIQAASRSSELALQLSNQELTRYCPTICVTAILSPLIVHIHQIRTSRTLELKQLHTHRYKLCMKFLRQLGELYWHASIYYDFFEIALPMDSSSERSMLKKDDDPLVDFLQRQMIQKIRRSDAVQQQDQQQQQQSQEGPSVESSGGTSNISGEYNHNADASGLDSISFDDELLRLWEHLQYGGNIHRMFPAA